MEGGQYEAAIALFSKALHIDPTHSASRKHLEQAKLQLGMSENGGNNTT